MKIAKKTIVFRQVLKDNQKPEDKLTMADKRINISLLVSLNFV